MFVPRQKRASIESVMAGGNLKKRVQYGLSLERGWHQKNEGGGKGIATEWIPAVEMVVQKEKITLGHVFNKV